MNLLLLICSIYTEIVAVSTHLNLSVCLHTEQMDPLRGVHSHHSVGIDPLQPTTKH